MSDTPHLALPLVAAAQAQKHVTVNEALRSLDALVQLAVLDRGLASPPASPLDGQRWIVAAAPTGAWAGHAGEIAAWQDDAWVYHAPQAGWVAYVLDEATMLVWDGASWADYFAAVTALQNLTLLGIGTSADATNPFAAKLNKALFTARTVAEGGDGDLRYTLNKESAADVLSLLMQTGFSGRAELGLVGDDNFVLKVSADGSGWHTALIVDKASGGVDFLAAEASVASATSCDIGAVNALKVAITGTTTITSFGARANAVRLIRFAGALSLTHNATSLVLPGGADVTTAAGDTALATSDASGNWRLRHYQRASGKPLTAPVATDVSDATATGRALLTAGSAGAGRSTLGLAAIAASGSADDLTTGTVARSVRHAAQLDVFTASGTYAVPSWARRLLIVTIAAGGGGGSGATGTNAANRFGGGGAGAGGRSVEEFDTADVSASLSVTIGSGGGGGALVTGTASGNNGAGGGTTTVKDGATTLVSALGGNGGSGGSTSTGTAGSGGSGITQANAGGSSSATAAGISGASLTRADGPGGGGAGGALDTAGNQRAGGDGGAGYKIGGSDRQTAGGTGGTSAGQAGTNGADKAWQRGAGAGGAGGAANASGNGGPGGNGGAPGGGGGGGAAARETANSGAGGNGGRGEAWIIAS